MGLEFLDFGKVEVGKLCDNDWSRRLVSGVEGEHLSIVLEERSL